MGLFGGTSRAVTLNYDETFCRKLFCAPVTSGTSRSARTYLYTSCVSFPLFWLHGKEAISEAVSRCILLIFLEVKLHQAHFILQLHIFMFFFLSIPPSVLLYWASLTALKHSTSLSATFVYIRVPPNNPSNVRAPSLEPRVSLFSEVSYRPFARGCHFTSMTIILQGFAFLCKLGLLLFKPR